MRPDKPGYWWWEDHKGRAVISEFDEDMIWRNAFCSCSIDDLEREATFIRWLGPAHPQKKVKRYKAGTQSHSVQQNNGRWVLYEDVKEFLVVDGDEKSGCAKCGCTVVCTCGTGRCG